LRALDQAGVRGARMDCAERGDPWGDYEQIETLHHRLPARWHVELGVTPGGAARLAPLLARVDRAFCLLFRTGCAPLTSEVRSRLHWWLAMGNVYVKLLPPLPGRPEGDWLGAMARDEPARVVIGSGWPGGDGLRHAAAWPEALCETADSNAQRLYDLPPGGPATRH
jgi:hypothetical protein